MKTIDQKEKFIELRAKGFSFEKISKEINVSKPTLIKWQSEFKTEISNSEFLNYQNIIEKHKLLKTNQVEILSDFLEKIWKELRIKDLSKVDIKDLIRIKNDVATQLNFKTHDIKYQTGEFEEYKVEPYFPTEKEVIIDL